MEAMSGLAETGFGSNGCRREKASSARQRMHHFRAEPLRRLFLGDTDAIVPNRDGSVLRRARDSRNSTAAVWMFGSSKATIRS